MEARTFNAVSLIALIHLFSVIFTNIALGLMAMAFWVAMMTCILSLSFYFSRFRGKFKLASILFTVFSYPAIAGIFILNGGISGPGPYGFLLLFLVLITITPPRTHIIWFILHSLIVCALFISEVTIPGFIVNPYRNKTEHIIDLCLSFVPLLLFFYVAASFLRKGYNHERKLAIQRLKDIAQQKRELEYLNQEKDRLFSIIGHDLRSPLNSIQGFLELISNTELSAKEHKEIQSQLLDLTGSTTALLNNLLLWSSKTGESLPLEQIDLQTSTEEVIQLMEPQAYKKNIGIIHTTPTHQLPVMAEKEMLQLVIRNVLSNAVKFTPSHGTINLWFEDKADIVEIFIEDNGIGIEEDKQRAIFSSKAKSTTGTENESGVGLGLVLCQEFMQAMNGSIRFRSVPGKGSTFVLAFSKA